MGIPGGLQLRISGFWSRIIQWSVSELCNLLLNRLALKVNGNELLFLKAQPLQGKCTPLLPLVVAIDVVPITYNFNALISQTLFSNFTANLV